MRTNILQSALTMALMMSWLPLQAQKSHGGGAGGMAPGRGSMGAPSQQSNSPIDHPSPGMTGTRGTEPRDHDRGLNAGTPGTQPGKPALSPKASPAEVASFPKLSTHLEGYFPQGTNLTTAASGFKNVGDFVAAAHVSHNLGIPFDQLKSKVVGGSSLGQAIHELRPDVDSKAESTRAIKEAKKALKESGS